MFRCDAQSEWCGVRTMWTVGGLWAPDPECTCPPGAAQPGSVLLIVAPCGLFLSAGDDVAEPVARVCP